jgi:uncharacterized protein (UPF0335 family)
MTDGNGGPLHGLSGYLTSIDKQDDELDHLRGQYMAACKGPRAAIKDVMASAREAGINMKAFREVLSAHRSDRRHDKRVNALEADDQASYAEMMEALGEYADTPLGAAALKRASDGDGTFEDFRT